MLKNVPENVFKNINDIQVNVMLYTLTNTCNKLQLEILRKLSQTIMYS